MTQIYESDGCSVVVIWRHCGGGGSGESGYAFGGGGRKGRGSGQDFGFSVRGVHSSKATARESITIIHDSITIMVVMLPKMVGSLLPVKVLLSLVKAILSYAIVLLLHHSEQSCAHLSLKSVPKDTPLPSLPWGSTALRFPSEIQFSRPQHEIYCLHYQSLTKKLGVVHENNCQNIWN